MAFENYFEGEDQLRDAEGRAHFERVAFSAERSHELRSVSKSIVGLLYGIALREGKVPPLDAPLLAQFPQYTDLPDLEQRRRWTVRHAMSMTLGIEWNENLSYDDPRNGQTAMDRAADPYRHVLGQPLVAAVGEKWIYCGGATALIGRFWRTAPDKSCPTMRVRSCSTHLGSGRPYGASVPTGNETSPPASACGPAIWRGSGR